MTPQKITIIRDVTVGDGIGQRVSYINYDEDTGILICPTERLKQAGIDEWNRIMDLIEDQRIIDGIGLLDHCIRVQDAS